MINEFKAFHKAETNFFSLVSFTQINHGNLIAFATGVQASGLNPAIVNQVDESFSTSLTACQSFYRQKNLPWALVLPQYFYDEIVESLLQQHTLQLTGKGVAMATLIKNIQFPSLNAPFKISEMQADLHTWSIPLIYGFESTPEVTEVYTTRHQQASKTNKSLYHFSGFVNDSVVCSLSLSLCEGNARIDDVATMPAYQKRGYATWLIYAALKHAQELNIDTCFLEASDSGLSLYKKIGFNELFINRYYEELLVK